METEAKINILPVGKDFRAQPRSRKICSDQFYLYLDKRRFYVLWDRKVWPITLVRKFYLSVSIQELLRHSHHQRRSQLQGYIIEAFNVSSRRKDSKRKKRGKTAYQSRIEQACHLPPMELSSNGSSTVERKGER